MLQQLFCSSSSAVVLERNYSLEINIVLTVLRTVTMETPDLEEEDIQAVQIMGMIGTH